MIYRSRHLTIYAGTGALMDSVFAFTIHALRRPRPKKGEHIFRLNFAVGCWRERHTPKLVWWCRRYAMPAWADVPECSPPLGTYLAPSPIGRYGRAG